MLVAWVVEGVWTTVAAVAAWIYVLPPVAGRLAIALAGYPEAEAASQYSRAYRIWWLLTQLQTPFNRLPFFEEVLRLMPGVYALWLNLWGSKVSTLVYWGPGAIVLDRYALRIDRYTVIGTRAVLAGHLAVKDEQGNYRVMLAPVEIGESAMIGAYSGLSPGCVIAPAEEVPAGTYLRPHTRWEGGARAKRDRLRAH